MAARTRKRSSWACGSANVPSNSTEFCVASTMNGSGSGRVVPSTVTWRSCIASSMADCVRGVARLISSTSRTFVKTGPGDEAEACRPRSRLEPVTSAGRRSGVPWTRFVSSPSARAIAGRAASCPFPGRPR